MEFPDSLMYTEEHEWTLVDKNIATVGITDFAQSELGDIIFVEFPEVGDQTTQGEPFGTIEAVKTVADLFSPFSGKIVEINESLNDSPERVNNDPYGEGWIVKIELSDNSEKGKLLNADDYREFIS